MCETHSLMAPVCWSSRRPLGVAAKFSRLSNNVSSHIILLERHSASWEAQLEFSSPRQSLFRTFTKAQNHKVCLCVDLQALRHMSRCCGHSSRVRGRNTLRQATGLDTKTANYYRPFVLLLGVKWKKFRSHHAPRNLGFVLVVVYSLQEETTYFRHALRILHLGGNLGENACFESVSWPLCDLYSVCKCEIGLVTSHLDCVFMRV